MTRAQDEYSARQQLQADRIANRKRTKREGIPEAVMRAKVYGHECRVCVITIGPPTGARIEGHHVIPRGDLRNPHHADNIVPICHVHHQDHHTTTNRIPRSVLTPAERRHLEAFATPGWADLWYPMGEDE